MKKDNRFLFNDIEILRYDGTEHIPTVVLYPNKENVLIGHQALEAASRIRDLNLDFKLKLGELRPDDKDPLRLPTATGGLFKSALDITKDFLTKVLEYIAHELPGLDRSNVSVVVAEPLAMQSGIVSADWLKNYRSNIRAILEEKGYSKVDFLPEPFAVYQQYRYGVRHEMLLDRRKYSALVIDFGGGTIDTSIIETTKDGDIRQGGRNSRPLGACSKPIGGYYINEQIAIRLYIDVAKQRPEFKTKLKKSLKVYRRWRKREIPSLDRHYEEHKEFCYHLEDLVYEIERAKVALVNSITNWDLIDKLNEKVPVNLKEDPWSGTSKFRSVNLTAETLRGVFINEIWKAHIKGAIEETLDRGRDDLKGNAVDVVLLSGGSCNFSWMEKLIERDFSQDLGEAHILTLRDFREVVSKGLAIECARRNWTDEHIGDFSSTTYNRLNLLLASNEDGFEVYRYKSQSNDLPEVADTPGVLLPSASVLNRLYNKPLEWKVRLKRTPSRRLSYYFLRSSLDQDDYESWLNVEELFLDSPSDARFDQYTTVRLEVSEDGTAKPTFIYRKGNDYVDPIKVEGRPFMVDMTDTTKTDSSTIAYLGIDFGTSNSAVSYVDSKTIKVFDARSKNPTYIDIQQLKERLPFPVAAPLSQFLAATATEKLVIRARDYMEQALSLAAYLAYAEYRSSKSRKATKIFKNLRQRSVGPLWGFIKEILPTLPADSLSSDLLPLVQGKACTEIDKLVTELSKHKHKKIRAEEIDPTNGVEYIANAFNRLLPRSIFGYFENVRKIPFTSEYEGRFRVAHGYSPPFVRYFNYRGKESFSDQESFIIDLAGNRAFRLSPLMFWQRCELHQDLEPGHCYAYDKTDGDGSHSFVSVNSTCTRETSQDSEDQVLQALSGLVDALCEEDQPAEIIRDFEIWEPDNE